MSSVNRSTGVLNKPRKRHYLLAHEAFRQMCEHDPLQFFQIMASNNKMEFLVELINQVEAGSPDDPCDLAIDDFTIETGLAAEKPIIIIKMPTPKAYVECFYVGVVLLQNSTPTEGSAHSMIKYYTLELGQGENGDCRTFCMWEGEVHYCLAELADDTEVDEFNLLISHHLDKN